MAANKKISALSAAPLALSGTELVPIVQDGVTVRTTAQAIANLVAGGGGVGTVTSVSVTTANGVSGTVATATTTPAITLVLGAITPASVTSTGTVTGTNITGTNTGDQTITLTDDVTGSGTGTFAATIAANAVTNAKSAQMAAGTLKGNNTGGASNPLDLTATQATAMLNAFVGDSGAGGTKGLVPAPAAGDAAASKFLKADGTFAVPAGTGGAGSVTSVAATAPAAGFTIAGSPITTVGTFTFTLADDLAAVEGLASTGIVRRTAANTWSAGTAVDLTSEVTGTLPVANGGTGITSLGAGIATWFGTPSSANLAAAVTDETGTGALVFALAPTLENPVVGTQTANDNSTKAASTAYVDASVATTKVFDVHSFYPGVPTASAKLLRVPVGRAVSFVANLAGSYGRASVAATASAVFDLQKNGSSIGAMTFAAAATTATFTTAGGTSQTLAAGDILSIIAPATPDATLADVGAVLVGTR